MYVILCSRFDYYILRYVVFNKKLHRPIGHGKKSSIFFFLYKKIKQTQTTTERSVYGQHCVIRVKIRYRERAEQKKNTESNGILKSNISQLSKSNEEKYYYMLHSLLLVSGVSIQFYSFYGIETRILETWTTVSCWTHKIYMCLCVCCEPVYIGAMCPLFIRRVFQCLYGLVVYAPFECG